MTPGELADPGEAYRIYGGLLDDIKQGGLTELLSEHAPELGALMARVTIGPKGDTVTLAALPDADPDSPDSTDRILLLEELSVFALAARRVCQKHYRPA